jgi:hypothetical protein
MSDFYIDIISVAESETEGSETFSSDSDPDLDVETPDQELDFDQCCGSELIFFGFGSTNYFFSDLDSDTDSDSSTNILTPNFSKCCL